MTRPEFALADAHIRAASAVLVMAHASPDGDCIGCALAMRHALRAIGKRADAYCQDEPRPELRFMPGADELIDRAELAYLLGTHSDGPRPFDLIVVVDTGDKQLLGDFYNQHPELFAGVPVVTFDHHKSNTRYGDVNVLIDSYGSCGQVLLDFFTASAYPIDADTATCLLTGIVTDTNHFRIPDTGVHSFVSAARLLELGARLVEINESLMVLDEVHLARLKARVLTNIRTDYAGKIAWLAIEDDELGRAVRAEDKLTSALSSYLRSLRGVQVGVVFLAKGDQIKMSFRGRAGSNVVVVANEWGGGGHTTAAGASASGRSLEDVVRQTITRLAVVNAEHFATL